MLQSLIFLAGSVLALVLLKRFVQKHEHASKKTHTNIYALQGKLAVVTTTIEPNKFGQVKIGGELWAARAHDNNAIEVGVQVEIVSVGGAHVVVKRIVQ